MDRTEDIVAAADAAGAGLAIQVGRFDDIDLAGGSPAAVRAVLGQHPEGRPQALPCRQLDARLDTAVSKGEAITGRDPRRGVAEIVHGLAPRGDLQDTVFKLRIVGQIPLQLVVAPSRRQAGDAAVADEIRTVAGLEEPGLRIQLGVNRSPSLTGKVVGISSVGLSMLKLVRVVVSAAGISIDSIASSGWSRSSAVQADNATRVARAATKRVNPRGPGIIGYPSETESPKA